MDAGSNASCFGSFQPEGDCIECAASLWCADFTIRLDEEAGAFEDCKSWQEDKLELSLERDTEWKEIEYAQDRAQAHREDEQAVGV
jgi:hypothetical protein